MAGAKEHGPAPAGSPVHPNITAPKKPFCDVRLNDVDAVPPAAAFAGAGALNNKPCGSVTVRVTGTVWVTVFASVPTALMLKLKVPTVVPDSVRLKVCGVPDDVAIGDAGGVQVTLAGTPVHWMLTFEM